jgi:hypothetical protein
MDRSAETIPEHGLSTRAWYSASISQFVDGDPTSILGHLNKNGSFDVRTTQQDAWQAQIRLLQAQLRDLEGWVLFEYTIPRVGRRIDVAIIAGSVVFVTEFKVGATEFDRSAHDQAWDYALDLKYFHEASHHAHVTPVLVATQVAEPAALYLMPDEDRVFRPLHSNGANLRQIIDMVCAGSTGDRIDGTAWANARYRPTPTIIEAARALYAQHSVEAIARFDAGAQNLRVTSERVEQLIDYAKQQSKKLICFVTGVPGAGKTLVGLNIATHRREEASPTHAVFLSGNGPLVAVLCEALARDEVERRRRSGDMVRKGVVREKVKAFIQNVHTFRDEALATSGPPHEHVVIFDEAQRAWNKEQTANFMQRKRGLPGFAHSEPEFLISYMDRHVDWAVIVCLVGGGQEINTGEAGIGAWLDAISTTFPAWEAHISSELTDSEYSATEAIGRSPSARFDDSLHLAVSMRSFRAENVSAFVKAVLDCDGSRAKDIFRTLGRYRLFLTRDLGQAKAWLRETARGTERYGLVASSKAQRLKPHAIDIRVNVDPIHWFLDERTDTRSSYFLEDAATEFQVQGLELDWTCVTWDADLRFKGDTWSYHDFRGSRWTNVLYRQNRDYLRNAYRVLLTRARQGMVIFVTEGTMEDETRTPAFYDATFDYLKGLGIPVLA